MARRACEIERFQARIIGICSGKPFPGSLRAGWSSAPHAFRSRRFAARLAGSGIIPAERTLPDVRFRGYAIGEGESWQTRRFIKDLAYL